MIFVVVNLDTHNRQAGWVTVDVDALHLGTGINGAHHLREIQLHGRLGAFEARQGLEQRAHQDIAVNVIGVDRGQIFAPI